VALLNIGEEATKGDATLRETYQILSQMKEIRFVGNVEGKDIPSGGADVVVCEGFTGNVILKMYEGVAAAAFDLTREVGKRRLWRLGWASCARRCWIARKTTSPSTAARRPRLLQVRITVYGRSNAGRSERRSRRPAGRRARSARPGRWRDRG
jgi:fatty acid/phospholipid biosynthesis enzyme